MKKVSCVTGKILMKQILSWNGNQKLQNIRGLILYQIEMKESEIMEKELKH